VRKLFTILLLIYSLWTWAQDNPNAPKKEKPTYKKEITAGLNLNTNGGLIGGLNTYYSYNYRKQHSHLYGLEIVQVKHDKEQRFSSLISGNSFILGKLNYLTSIRPQFGHTWQMFQKTPQDGVRLNLVLAGGPTFGIVTPYFIRVEEGGVIGKTVTERYDPRKHHAQNIVGRAGYFYGFGKSELQMGFNLKTAVNLEFGLYKGSMTGLEVGWTLEMFPKEIVLLQSRVTNPTIFNALSLTLFYGSRY